MPEVRDANEGQKPYEVSQFLIQYVRQNSGLPDPADVTKQKIDLGSKQPTEAEPHSGFVVPGALERKWLLLQPGMKGKVPESYKARSKNDPNPNRRVEQIHDISLDDLGGGVPKPYYTSAIWAISDQIRAFLNGRGVIGVYVTPSPKDIDANGNDLRGEDGRTTLTLQVYTGVVREVRTVASGDRVPQSDRINNAIHARILRGSPVVAADPTKEAGPQNLLRRDLLDPYVFALNRHPGRRVDVAVSAFTPPADAANPNARPEPGAVVLDYLVTEAKPWALYAQVSNTGTKDTNEWRERFGYVNNQLTNRDDILSIDYVTASFADSNAVQGYYEAPLFDSRKWRWRVAGTYSQFTASDVGQSAENFDGQQYDVGGELIFNVYQGKRHKDFFVDLFAGVKYERVRVNNRGIDVSGSAGFFVPYGGVRAQRLEDTRSMQAELTLSGRLTDASQNQLNALGRFGADDQAMVLQFQASQSFFLEPIFDKKRFEEARSTLAHEVVFAGRAQTSFGARLIPQAEDVIGGLYSVRGYDESVASGDTSFLLSAEYRWHVPRSFGVQELKENSTFLGMKAFKWAPQQAYGRPDWDLILRTFVDAGWTFNADRLGFEHDETLVGAGVGVELQVKQNLSLRLDWGFPLTDLQTPGQETDSSRLHVSATVLW